MTKPRFDDPSDIPHEPFQRGLVQVYTGNGKGKTTAALGLALRAAGHGLRTHVIQFLKGVHYGELSALAALPAITVRQFGGAEWVHPEAVREEDRRRARQALAYAGEALAGGEYKLVILDEINVALDWRLLEVAPILDLIRTKPTGIELVLTGRNAPPEIIAAADLVSEMREVKHPFQQGILARCGIEF